MNPGRVGIAVTAALLGAAGAVVAVACSVQEVTVAQVMPGNNTGGPCTDTLQCSPEAYCAKPSCGASQGRCEQRPFECPEDAGTMCGCDGVNYWNDCLRQQNGVTAATQGECTTQFVPCGGFRGTPCPAPGAFCARLEPGGNGFCDPGAQGVCWVLPRRCPFDDGGALWESCGPRPATCVSFCEAIRAERPYRLPVDPSACP
jgi:hypothetical protein